MNTNQSDLSSPSLSSLASLPQNKEQQQKKEKKSLEQDTSIISTRNPL
jgi:hypothetical protein